MTTEPTGYRILDPAPECCGTCTWFYRDEMGDACYIDDTAKKPGDVPVVGWGWCEKWERADD